LHLLQKSGIPEAKAYGKASVGALPRSVPHLDTRVLGGKCVILFGPFATFSTKDWRLWQVGHLFHLIRIFHRFLTL
jgi:L-2-hydroxyglutarate oxidase LhgO